MLLSYSKLATYGQCPLRYRFTYLDRLPRRPRRLFRAARRIHHALMRWLTYARAGTPRWEEIEAAYRSAWGAAGEPPPVGERDYEEGLEILRSFHEANRERPCRPVYLEHRLSVPLGGHVLTAVLDRVDAGETGYEVIDYKLHREVRTQEEADADLQLGLYHAAIEETHGVSPEALTLYYLRHGIQRTTTRTREQARELKRWVAATGDDITAEREWKPCVGDHCGGCDFRAACPAHTGRPLPPPARLPSAAPSQLSLLLPEPGPAAARAEGGKAGGQLSLPILP